MLGDKRRRSAGAPRGARTSRRGGTAHPRRRRRHGVCRADSASLRARNHRRDGWARRRRGRSTDPRPGRARAYAARRGAERHPDRDEHAPRSSGRDDRPLGTHGSRGGRRREQRTIRLACRRHRRCLRYLGRTAIRRDERKLPRGKHRMRRAARAVRSVGQLASAKRRDAHCRAVAVARSAGHRARARRGSAKSRRTSRTRDHAPRRRRRATDHRRRARRTRAAHRCSRRRAPRRSAAGRSALPTQRDGCAARSRWRRTQRRSRSSSTRCVRCSASRAQRANRCRSRRASRLASAPDTLRRASHTLGGSHRVGGAWRDHGAARRWSRRVGQRIPFGTAVGWHRSAHRSPRRGAGSAGGARSPGRSRDRALRAPERGRRHLADSHSRVWARWPRQRRWRFPFLLDQLAQAPDPVGPIVGTIGDALALRSGLPKKFDGAALHTWAARSGRGARRARCRRSSRPASRHRAAGGQFRSRGRDRHGQRDDAHDHDRRLLARLEPSRRLGAHHRRRRRRAGY